jgi:hypothetical protein
VSDDNPYELIDPCNFPLIDPCNFPVMLPKSGPRFKCLEESAFDAREARIVELEALLREGVKAWSFNDEQQHTHTWHERADWVEKVKAALGDA